MATDGLAVALAYLQVSLLSIPLFALLLQRVVVDRRTAADAGGFSGVLTDRAVTMLTVGFVPLWAAVVLSAWSVVQATDPPGALVASSLALVAAGTLATVGLVGHFLQFE